MGPNFRRPCRNPESSMPASRLPDVLLVPRIELIYDPSFPLKYPEPRSRTKRKRCTVRLCLVILSFMSCPGPKGRASQRKMVPIAGVSMIPLTRFVQGCNDTAFKFRSFEIRNRFWKVAPNHAGRMKMEVLSMFRFSSPSGNHQRRVRRS
ncbi:hypothetical protein HPP92_008594 [Vanilla planifolia]|uniref:Uncharacterized protein n=1 Tax=Vanilla planifolia TaxID=51239 RepID=A0A835RAR0_VANPL|nr:hypothetical protein HPP92_008594 [Vanilla planifolia]